MNPYAAIADLNQLLADSRVAQYEILTERDQLRTACKCNRVIIDQLKAELAQLKAENAALRRISSPYQRWT